MNIEISPQEYRDLLDILHLADVIMTGHRHEEDKRTNRQRALIQKLYALAGSTESGRWIRLDESIRHYIPTTEFEENSVVHRVIEEFADHLFWDELISRLSTRDATLAAGGIDNLNAMSAGERRIVEGPIRQRYIAEFTANNIAHLEVVHRFGNGGAAPVKTSD